MNSFERVTRRLAGQSVDRAPNFNIFMAYGAHAVGQPLSRYYLDHRVLCDANDFLINTLKVDLAQAISDPYRETADFGADVRFPEDSLPVCPVPLLASPSDLVHLSPPNPYTGKRMSDRIAAVSRMRDRYRNDVPVMGWVEGALAEATDLRGVSAAMMDLYDHPDFLGDLLEMCVEVEIAFARAQIEAGADIIDLGDAVASQISPRMYRKWALPYEQRILAAVHDMGALARLHICGDTSRILGDMAKSGADIIDIDWMVPMDRAATSFAAAGSSPDDHAPHPSAAPTVCGNIDPVSILLRGTPEEVYIATQRCLTLGMSRCFSAAGCEIPLKTPRANLEAQIRALCEFEA
jgi:uroporphyrinogen decarboxylase